MSDLFDRLFSFYEKSNWPMAQVPEETILSTTFQGNEGQWVFVASVDETHKVVTMFARTPKPCPAEEMGVMCEFIARANFGMTHGAWVMDYRE